MSAIATELSSPYKGLAPFEDSELDALLFFGRERETEIIVSNLLAAKLTVLYGPSGVGKSSVLGAAVVRRLRELEPGASVTVVDDWTGEVDVPDMDFLILDQFEEYFLYHDARDGFAEALAASPAHVLIALREDQLAQLDAFQADLPNVFANRLRLDHLDRSAARAAIVGPLDRWNAAVDEDERVGIETALVDEVLGQVATGPDQVEAPYLQLVLERVWEEEQDSGSRILRRSALERLGGAQAIVGAHLERALSALPPRDADIATNALRFLVTPSRTKIAHTLDDLVGYTNESPVVLQGVLERLAAQRVLRAGDGGRYEIFHDVLAEPLLAWRREREARAALAAAHRRHRRLAIVAGAAVALAAAMIALTVYAFSQRSEASKQKRVALAQKETAVEQEHIARAQKKAADDARVAALAQKQRADRAARRAREKAEEARLNAARATRNEKAARANAALAQASEENAKHSAAAAKASALKEARAKRLAVKLQHTAQHNAQLARASALRANVLALVETSAADLTVNPVLSVKASLAAAKLASTPPVEDALRKSLGALWVHGILSGGNTAAFSPDSSLVATGGAGGEVRLYRAQTNALVHTWKAGSAVNKVVFSPDGTQLAVATAGKVALLYDVATFRLEQRLDHGGAVLDIAYVEGGQNVVTASADRSTRIWNAQTGAPIRTIVGSAAQLKIAVSRPDGSRFAVATQGLAAATVYDSSTGDVVFTVQPPGEVTDLAFSPNGAYLVTTGRRNGFVWDTTTWSLLHTLVGHSAPIDDVAFANDGRVVTGSVDSSAIVWDPATGDELSTLLGQHEQKVLGVAFSPDGSQVATSSADETVRVWNAPLGSTPRLLSGDTDVVSSVSFSPNGSLLLTTSPDGSARLWLTDVQNLHTVAIQKGAISAAAYSPDGKLVLAAGADGTVGLYEGDRLVRSLPQGGKVTAASFTPDGRDVLTAGDDGTAKLWRVSDGTLLATFPHGAPVRAALIAGQNVVTGGDDGKVDMWTRGGKLVWSAKHGSPVATLAAGKTDVVASGAADGTVKLWRGANGAPVGTLKGHTGAITSLAFNNDGSRLVSGSADHTAIIWNTASRTAEHTLVGHQFGITSVTFNPAGTRVLTASADGDAWIWSVKTGQWVHKLKFHVSTVSRAAFSPDGRWVVTAGPTAAAIWQVSTGKRLMAMHGAHGNLTTGAWAPDSLRIVTGDTGGGVETFTCTLCARLPALVAIARARIAGLG